LIVTLIGSDGIDYFSFLVSVSAGALVFAFDFGRVFP